jgi:hypothetical protein
VKLDASGNLQWNVSTYNAYSVSPTEDGGFVVAGGQGNPTQSDEKSWLAKFAPSSAVPAIPSSAVAFILLLIAVVLVIAAIAVIFRKKIKSR